MCMKLYELLVSFWALKSSNATDKYNGKKSLIKLGETCTPLSHIIMSY